MENVKLYKGLPSDEEEQLYQLFSKIVYLNNLNYDSANEYFKPGKETFAYFLELLEQETEWFNYRQMDEIFDELSFYILDLD